MKKIAVFGAGGMGRETRWLIEDINKAGQCWDFIGYFDDDFSLVTKTDSRYFLGGTEKLNGWDEEIYLVIAIGNPTVKKTILKKLVNPLIKFPVLIHPGVTISNINIEIGEGTIICAGCIVTVDIQIGRHVLLNLGTIVCHDSIIGDYTSIMPSVNISGDVYIGESVYIGTGAKIINQLEIGNQTIIGAGAVVASSMPSKCTVVGIPAKPIKFH